MRQAFETAKSSKMPCRVADVVLQGDEAVDVTFIPTCSGNGFEHLCLILLTKSGGRGPEKMEEMEEVILPPPEAARDLSAPLSDVLTPVLPGVPERVDSGSLSRLSAGSGGGSGSLGYSSSESGLSLSSSDANRRKFVPLTDTLVQTDQWLLRGPEAKDASTNTEIAWGRNGFRCTTCSKPPIMPGTVTADQVGPLMEAHGRKSRRKIAKTGSALDGLWTVILESQENINPCFHRLCFLGRKCVDHEGNRWYLAIHGSEVFLASGRVSLEGEYLMHIDRPNGLRASFTKGKGGRDLPPLLRVRKTDMPQHDSYDDSDGADMQSSPPRRSMSAMAFA